MGLGGGAGARHAQGAARVARLARDTGPRPAAPPQRARAPVGESLLLTLGETLACGVFLSGKSINNLHRCVHKEEAQTRGARPDTGHG